MRAWLTWLTYWVRVVILRRKLWQLVEVDDGTTHCYPLMDLVTHTAEDDCVCGPRTELHQEDDHDLWLVMHHSLDARETREHQRAS